jgi:hypothetical protein
MGEYKLAKNRLKQLQHLFKEGDYKLEARDEFDKLFFKWLKNMPVDMMFNFGSVIGVEDIVLLNHVGIYNICFEPYDEINLKQINYPF